jgi:hypothetical protein
MATVGEKRWAERERAQEEVRSFFSKCFVFSFFFQNL